MLTTYLSHFLCHFPTETIVGVNKYRLEKEEPVEVLSIDNSKTIKSQIAKLDHLAATRDQQKVSNYGIFTYN